MSAPVNYRGAFLLGDYPLIYAKEPTTLEAVTREEFFLPISAYRIYFTAAKCDVNLTSSKVIAINSLMIDQAVRYVCGPDKEFLELCVKYWRVTKGINALPLMRQLLFDGDETIADVLTRIAN